jgi:hypothetical protein
VKKEKNVCIGCKHLFFLPKNFPNKEFLSQDDEKLPASAQRQARHTEKISGCCNFCGECSYNI